MGNIKLFVDAHSFDTEYQGVRTFVKEIYSVLLRKYPDLDIYFGAANVKQLQSELPIVPKSNLIQYKKTSGFGRFLFEIPKILDEYAIEVSHFQYMVPFGKKRGKYIVTTHDILFNDFKSEFSFFYRSIRNMAFQKGMKAADIKTTVSEYSRQRIAHYYKISPHQIHVIPNGVNAGFGKRFANQEGARQYIAEKFNISNFILYVSRIEPRKNHLSLLKAYADSRLFEKDLSLVFIGKESIPVKDISKYVRLDNDRHQVFWLSQVDQHDLESFFQACKVFAYPSKAEGFGIPPLEAAMSRVPVLCSNKTAMMEYDFFEPYLFDPFDQQELTRKLIQIVTTPQDQERLENIAQAVLRRYRWEESADKLYKLIRRCSEERIP